MKKQGDIFIDNERLKSLLWRIFPFFFFTTEGVSSHLTWKGNYRKTFVERRTIISDPGGSYTSRATLYNIRHEIKWNGSLCGLETSSDVKKLDPRLTTGWHCVYSLYMAKEEKKLRATISMPFSFSFSLLCHARVCVCQKRDRHILLQTLAACWKVPG